VVLLAVAAGLIAPASASAAITSVFAGHTVSGAPIPCTAQPGGTSVCHGSSGTVDLRLASFDGQPLSVYVTLPPGNGPFPLIIQSHGWGVPTSGPSDTQYYGPSADAWAQNGYAVVQLTARGFGDSCGTPQSRAADPAGCQNGYIRLDDERYEARDAQFAAGLLVDEGVADPSRIGATGESYGGGVSLELATLKDRVMNADGTLSPWTSPAGVPLHIAAAAPVIPWSDLTYSLMPNGRTLDYTGAGDGLAPIGVEKQSFVSGLYAEGNTSGYYAPAGTNPQADLTTWYTALNAGEPYDGNAEDEAIAQQIARYHSPYYLLAGAYNFAREAPAPLLIANGFTDDLFPVDEAVRYYNLEQSLYPSDPISLFDGDFGHMRAQNKPGDEALLSSAIQSLFAYYLKGSGPQPANSATATIETCPAGAASGGPYTAPSWSALHPGEVDYASNAAQTVSSAAGNPAISRAIDPIAGDGACATVSSADQGTGVATYRLPAVTGNGYTLLGSPTVIANLNVTGQFAFIAARLWDVDPASGTQTLLARGVYRIDSAAPNGLQVFQLHPGAWHFAAGHIPKLELLGQDSPYVRSANGAFSISVSNLQLRLPVHEIPGAPGTPSSVASPRPPVSARSHGCIARPYSRIARRRTRASRRRLAVFGTAGEHGCAGAAAAKPPRIAHVYVMIYRSAPHGRCRFLERGGRLSRARSCRRPIEFLARGSTHWSLWLRTALPPGHYVIRADPVDRLHRHQLPSAASVARVTIR
jgi:dienelactone hydrolase